MSEPTDPTITPETTSKETTSTTSKEEAFVEAVRKKAVTFNIPVPDGGDKVSVLRSVRAPQPEKWQDKTGAGTRHIATGPETGQHPLRDKPEEMTGLEEASMTIGDDLAKQGKKKRPGMAGALLVGDQTEASSSMRNADPKLHPMVATILKELEDSGGRMGTGHGQCAEVGAISNHLWAIDPSGTFTRTQAQAYFERRGAVTIAHTLTSKDELQVTPACPSCQYLTDKLCIATVRRPLPDITST